MGLKPLIIIRQRRQTGMGTNVYGSRITKMTVKELMGYEEERRITRFELADAAMEMINREQKLDRARNYLSRLENNYGSFNAACTKCLIYNATGDTMTFIRYYDWCGHIGESAYPTVIGNGQWGIFFHHKPSALPSSDEGAVVYRCKDLHPRPDVDCLMSWCTGWGWNPNHCYATIQHKGFFTNARDSYWDGTERRMFGVTNRQHVDTSESGNLEAELTIGGDSIAEWKAVVKLLR